MTEVIREAIRIGSVEISPDHYIGGRRVSSKHSFTDISPIDGTVLGEVSAAGEHEVDMAVRAAESAFSAWAALGPQGRGVYLRHLADVIERNVERLALVETTDNGSLLEASRLRVMKRGAHNIRFFADWAERLEGETWSSNGVEYQVRYEPSGVAALITPWNAPFMLSTWKVGPALASGATVVLKPPEWAPLTCSMLADFVDEAGLPPGVFNLVQGIGEDAGASLVNHPGVRRISFTGSPETGRIIGQAAAQRIVPVSLELGGKSPLIVFADADFDAAVRTALGQYDNAGQVCLAGTRILVEASIADRFQEAMVAGAAKLKLDDPRDPATEVGPLITQEHLDRVRGFVQRAVADGARVVYGGDVSREPGGLYFEPTLLMDAAPASEILRREVFGPVLTLQPFDREEEVIAMANDTEFGLAATVFTSDDERAQRISDAVSAGTVWVNTFYARDLAAPFGGNKHSGVGREGGTWSFDFYCDVKTVAKREGTLRTRD